MNIINKIKFEDAIIDNINNILLYNNIPHVIARNDLIITSNSVTDAVKPDGQRKLSDVIMESLLPSISSAYVYHYTSREAAEEIINKEVFRLTNISKRYSDGELLDFPKTHQFSYFLEEDKSGYRRYKNELMPSIFYASFTDINITKNEEEKFWTNFSPCDGVRLKFRITAVNEDFRKVYYEKEKNKPIKLLSDIIQCMKDEYNLKFIFRGLSKLSMFYLSGLDYGWEKEYRMLYRLWDRNSIELRDHKGYTYVELPLNIMDNKSGYKLDLIEVCSNEIPRMPSSYSFLKRNA